MTVAFLMMLIAMFIARNKRKRKSWYTIHRNLNIFAAIGTAAAMIIAYVMIALTHGMHFVSLHAIIGLVTFVFVVITPIVGFGIRSRKVKPVYKKKVRVVHHWLGRLTLVLMAVNIYFGVQISGLIYIL
jgi:hypothetical protein